MTREAPQRECAFEVVTGKTLTLYANNTHSAKFIWDGPCVPDGRSCKNLLMNADKKVTLQINQD